VVAGLRLLSDLASRAKLAMQAGLSFGGDRDLYSALGYSRVLTPGMYRGRFIRDGIAARVVEVKPQETWRGGAEIIEDEDESVETEFEQTWDELNKRLHIWSVFQRLDTLAGLGRYAVLFVGLPGDSAVPAGKVRNADDVLYLTPYAEEESTIQTWDTNTQSERFGQPLTYKLKRATSGGKSIDVTAHWTRVLHVADGGLEDTVYGVPRLERVYNLFDNVEKVVGSGSEAFWRRVHRGTQVEVDPAIKVSDAELADMKEQIKEYEHNLRRTLTTRGVTIQELGGDVSNFGPQITSLMALISGATGIPQRLLLGSERGELASTQDKKAWDERIQDRRDSYAEPIVVRPFIDLLTRVGVLPEVEDYSVRWPAMVEHSETEKADIATKWADLNSKQGDIVVLASEIRGRVLGLDPIEDSVDEMDLEKMREELKPPAPVLALPPGGDPNANAEPVEPVDQPTDEDEAQ